MNHLLQFCTTAIADLADLIYPRSCAGCNEQRPVTNGIFCIDCLAGLPLTGYHATADNPMEQHFWGRVPVEAGAALLFFVPGGRAQKLLHNIKYHGNRHYAEAIGTFYGEMLSTTTRFAMIEGVVPVPLHWRRAHKRGFNQSLEFGKGLARELKVPLFHRHLVRRRQTPTQTRKSRIDRIRNMREAFAVRHVKQIQGKHLLLVDDVLTTGATLEACTEVLLTIPDVRISVATIACGRI